MTDLSETSVLARPSMARIPNPSDAFRVVEGPSPRPAACLARVDLVTFRRRPSSAERFARMDGMMDIDPEDLPSFLEGLEAGRDRDVEELGLRGCGLEELPASLATLPRLRKLDLSGNRLAGLPREWAGSLRELDLSGNSLHDLPACVVAMPALEWLDASRNLLNRLPQDLGRMRGLRHLDLGHNRLEKLPLSMTDLQGLERLYLDNNLLKHFPEPLAHLSGLVELRLEHNRIGHFPRDLHGLSGLRELTLEGNPLGDAEQDRIAMGLPRCTIY
ncbi:MAG: leucine-rich repeat domain-containing protein [Isosphaeraceae bacterium]